MLTKISDELYINIDNIIAVVHERDRGVLQVLLSNCPKDIFIYDLDIPVFLEKMEKWLYG